MPQVEVSFDIDANGILNVSAKDKATGKEQKIVIKASSGLNEEEIKRMVRDAEAHAEEDKRFRELVDTRNKADGLIHAVEKTLQDLGDKVDAAERAKVESRGLGSAHGAQGRGQGRHREEDRGARAGLGQHRPARLCGRAGRRRRAGRQRAGAGGGAAAARAAPRRGRMSSTPKFEEVKDKGRKAVLSGRRLRHVEARLLQGTGRTEERRPRRRSRRPIAAWR